MWNWRVWLRKSSRCNWDKSPSVGWWEETCVLFSPTLLLLVRLTPHRTAVLLEEMDFSLWLLTHFCFMRPWKFKDVYSTDLGTTSPICIKPMICLVHDSLGISAPPDIILTTKTQLVLWVLKFSLIRSSKHNHLIKDADHEHEDKPVIIRFIFTLG